MNGHDTSWSMPVDVPILESLPPEGATLGYHVLGATVKTILEKMNEGLAQDARMSPGIVSQRITRWLRPMNLVVEVKVHGAGGAKGYQITPRGREVLEQLKGRS